jgi:hypothetical protein
MSLTDSDSGTASSILADLPPMFETTTLARVLGISERRAIDMRRDGTGPTFHKLGRSVRYSRAAVAAFLAANQHQRA